MDKNLGWKLCLVLVVTLLASWALFPPSERLKPGIDLAGGTSLVYEIDSQGLGEGEKHKLAERMITVLRRRIDPANIQNLIWRPQGNTRFEVQMPLASKEARVKRSAYEEALNNVLEMNLNPAIILRNLDKPAEQRKAAFDKFASDNEKNQQILSELAKVYDERKELQKQRDQLLAKMDTPKNLVKMAGLNLDDIEGKIGDWAVLTEVERDKAILEYLGGKKGNVDLLTRFTKMYTDWAAVTDKLVDPENGANIRYEIAQRELDNLNVTTDEIEYILSLDQKSKKRTNLLAEFKEKYPARTDKLQQLVTAYEAYKPFQGRLDDAKDLKRMLKGAGILEFRILPTTNRSELSSDETNLYRERLKDKGPAYASDEKYTWIALENHQQWNAPNTIVEPFGDKYYVLASNQADEKMVHSQKDKDWRLISSRPTSDNMGRRAIGFGLDERGGLLFSKLTGANIARPLCILLDDLAVSAPNISTRIYMQGTITGTFSQTEVEDMVSKLEAGALPARLIEQPISEKIIGPSIGADNRDKTIKAGIMGFVAVVLIMMCYYIVAGTIADIALVINVLMVLGVMAAISATFTLPGIAGLILTIGMSVDANVLIYERIREEQLRGASLKVATRNGYQRAFRTIFDANLTTFITAAILLWVGSEEIKGFAIVLMVGIASSMFTALFVTRVIMDILQKFKLLKNKLTMLRLIHQPNVNWMGLRPVFLAISAFLMFGGLFIFFTRDENVNSKYDIEFTGGTSATITLRDDVEMTRSDVEQAIHQAGNDLGNPAIATANIYSVGKSQKQFEITTTETNKLRTTVTFAEGSVPSIDELKTKLTKAQRKAGVTLTNLIIAPAGDKDYTVSTSYPNKTVITNVLTAAFENASIAEPENDEVVNKAILKAFGDNLEMERNLQPVLAGKQRINDELIDDSPELGQFMGGIVINVKLGRAVSGDELDKRFKDIRFRPDLRNLKWYSSRLLNADFTAIADEQEVTEFVYVSAMSDAGLREVNDDEWARFESNEEQKVLAAARQEASLSRVTQINPSIGAEAKTRALIAIVLSLFAIVAYIWIRFGDLRYGLAAITSLVHDVCITLGAVTVCTYIANSAFGKGLLIGDFKIDLAMIAAFLTLIGYSLNDTIVVFDRIRENRHKKRLTPDVINNSINQTISRTIMTSLTTLVVIVFMYIFGAPNLRGFAFAIIFGIIIGTYSSIAIAAPILLFGKKTVEQKK
jgi:SecD/SecF fusion protein